MGALINHEFLAEELCKRKLFSQALADEVKKLTIAVLAVDGGLAYREHDSKLTPKGPKLLGLAKELEGREPIFTERLPWWRSE